MVNPQYPQCGTSNLAYPINLAVGSVTSSPNNSPYNVVPLTSMPYQINQQPQQQVSNVCSLFGY